ncbi:MAG: hypothetical protein R3E02_02710 [Blastomonas sp.]
MTVRQIQWGIAAVFLILGGWCLVSPQSVIELTIRPERITGDPLVNFAIGCFGAQACLGGLFVGFSRFTRTTFMVYAIALLPFFGFNWWFMVVDPLFTPLGMLDALGNAIMLGLCLYGMKQARIEQSASSG